MEILSIESWAAQLAQTSLLPLPKSLEQVQILCTAILREMSPYNDLSLSWDKIQDTKLLSLDFAIILAQGSRKTDIEAVGQRVVKILEGRLPDVQKVRPLLPLLSKVISLAPASLHEDQINLLSKQMVDWLRYASVQQGVPQSSGGFFNPRARQASHERKALFLNQKNNRMCWTCKNPSVFRVLLLKRHYQTVE
ncbi:hypothetical protein JRQ81_016708 [Phrynocephalus forsythii]|uniref:AP-5 complex subunit zeta-1 N-terminal TPR domain-containing protein n=1 Tax=Phrynocephalus forsythii TaxID=171643 RepID=A0A9Q1B0U5_9SAUR|nr:hypothetical protein JRQ81_016708 [Phrynocephalus forsythii]